jgi:hypothetical protein
MTAAEADLAQQEASYQIASFDKDAYTKLAETGAASNRRETRSYKVRFEDRTAVILRFGAMAELRLRASIRHGLLRRWLQNGSIKRALKPTCRN